MTFYLTTQNISDNCLRNIYSGIPNTRVFSRSSNQDHPSMQYGYNHVTAEEKFDYTQRVFFTKYDMSLPRAPAYRAMPRKKIDKIVERLYSPPKRSKTPGQDSPKPKTNHSLLKKRKKSARPKSVESTHGNDTVCSSVRKMFSEHRNRPQTVPDLSNSCERFGVPPSERYFRSRSSMSQDSREFQRALSRISFSSASWLNRSFCDYET